MPSFRLASPVAAMFAMSMLAGCGSDGGGGGPVDGHVDGLAAEAKEIFAAGTTENEAIALADELEAAAAAGDNVTADARAFALTGLALTEYHAGHLEGGSGVPTALATFLKNVFQGAGLAVPPLSAASLSNEGIVEVVQPSGGTFRTRTLHAGIDLPTGALPRQVLLAARRLPDAAAHSPMYGPLPTSLDQYPLFYEFSLTPAVTLSADAILGICEVSEPSSPYYAPDDVFRRLQLAHPDPDNSSNTLLLEKVNVPFVDCDDVATRTAHGASLLARRPAIGGLVRTFSLFGAVDPETPQSQGATGIRRRLGHGPITTVPGEVLARNPFPVYTCGLVFHVNAFGRMSCLTQSSARSASSSGPKRARRSSFR